MIVVTQLIESAPHHYEIHTEKFLFSLPKAQVSWLSPQSCGRGDVWAMKESWQWEWLGGGGGGGGVVVVVVVW